MAGHVQEGWQASGYVSVFFFLLGVSVGVIWPKSWQSYHSALLFALVKQACPSRISIPTVSYYYTTLYSVHTKKKRRSVKCFFFFLFIFYIFLERGGKKTQCYYPSSKSIFLFFLRGLFFVGLWVGTFIVACRLSFPFSCSGAEMTTILSIVCNDRVLIRLLFSFIIIIFFF